MSKNKLISYFMAVSILTFLAVFFYIVERSYDNLMKPVSEAKQNVIIKPIDPNLDVNFLDEISKRNYHPEP